jgi:hypothetical protein
MHTDTMTGAAFAKRHDITARATGGELDRDAQGWDHYSWQVRLTMYGRSLTVPFRMGTAHARNGKPTRPTAGEVLESLVLDAQSGKLDFAEFCGDYGYDEDSRRALATWHACRKAREDLQNWAGNLFGALMTVRDS